MRKNVNWISRHGLAYHPRSAEGGVFFAIVSMNVAVVRGAVLADLVVEYDSSNVRLQIDKMFVELLDSYYSTGLWESYSLFYLILPSISKSREILEIVRRAKGVSSAALELVEDRYEFYDYLYEAVDRKLATLQLA